MDFLIVTGLSGAGKSQAARVLEDLGFFCIDNIPPDLFERFFEICRKSDPNGRFAAVMDIRSCGVFGDLLQVLRRYGAERVRVLYLDASNDVLIGRYKETRRRHPLMSEAVASVYQAVELERKILSDARATADYIIDTSRLSVPALRERLGMLFADNLSGAMTLSLCSFGYKYGVLPDADIMLDVRCLPNPFYVPALQHLTGCDAPVYDYVFGSQESQALYAHIHELISYTLPLYIREGKCHLTVGIGCTGGRHRSVAFVRRLGAALAREGYGVSVLHRDMGNEGES